MDSGKVTLGVTISVRRIFQTFEFCIVTILVVLSPAACQPRTPQYKLTGEVVQTNPYASIITVKHEEIPGFMPAMTMPYKVNAQLMAGIVQAGDRISADIVFAGDQKEYWLDNIRITDISGRNKRPSFVQPRTIPPGELVSDIELINQDGKEIHLADFRGKALLVTFIYTRCPLPAFCPRLSSEFARVHERLAQTPDDYARTHLLTISFDPAYDTPAVLRKYGLAYLRDKPEGFAHWDFALTKTGELEKLATTFGLFYLQQADQISHTMNVVLIAPDGTIAKYWTNEWSASELEDALRQSARHKESS